MKRQMIQFILCIIVGTVCVVADDIGIKGIAHNDLPGALYMNKVYNMMSGQGIVDQHGVDIMDYSWSDDVFVQGYHVPKEFRSTPTIEPRCDYSNEVSSVYSSTSTEVLNMQSSSKTGGYSQTTDVSASIGIPKLGLGVEASTTYTNALMFGRSSTSVSGRSHFGESYTRSFSMATATKLYQAEIDWLDTSPAFHAQFKDSFMNDVESLNGDSSSKNVLWFIYRWGTHVMQRMTAGAFCKETAYTKSSASIDQVTEFRNHVKTNSASFMFMSYETDERETDQHSDTYTNGVEYTFSDIFCDGEVDNSASCGGLTGTRNNPVPTSYELLSVFEIDAVAKNLSSAAMGDIDDFFVNLYQSLYECANQHCYGKGTCSLSEKIWSISFIQNWNGDFSKLWDTNDASGGYKCFCLPGRTGDDCQWFSITGHTDAASCPAGLVEGPCEEYNRHLGSGMFISGKVRSCVSPTSSQCQNDNDCSGDQSCVKFPGGPSGWKLELGWFEASGSNNDCPLTHYCVSLGDRRTSLKHLGWEPTSPLGVCEGDCDEDSDCKSGLKCIHNRIPFGCVGKMEDPTYDYCGGGELKSLGWSPPTPLGICEGDCDFDSDCETGLTCYHNQIPVYCKGTMATSAYDYCGYPFSIENVVSPLIEPFYVDDPSGYDHEFDPYDPPYSAWYQHYYYDLMVVLGAALLILCGLNIYVRVQQRKKTRYVAVKRVYDTESEYEADPIKV